MIKMQIIGFLGKDCEVKIHGIESVLNFSVAHTDKYKDGNGILVEKTTWVSCSWWVEKTTIAQYLKRGSQVYIEGFPEAKVWKKKDGDPQPFLNMRVFSLQLLGSARKAEGDNQQNASTGTQSSGGGYEPYNAPTNNDDPNDLPF